MNTKERAKIESHAEKLVKRGKIQDAVQEYQKLLQGDEQDIRIHNLIGDLYVRARDISHAVSTFQEIAGFYEEKGLYTKSIAILKRISRLDPDCLESVQKLAELYQSQGFTSEAKSEYAKLAKAREDQGDVKQAIQIYAKLVRLSSEDMDSRFRLAQLYAKEGMTDQAVEQYNTVAERKLRENALSDASKLLAAAKKLDASHSRTLTNLIELYNRENKKKEALALINEILKKDKDNLKALYLQGNFFLESNKFKEAEAVFTKIISLRPKEVEARVKLGKIYIGRGKLDKAYEFYEPLVDTLIRKQKEDKAVGLLGLILASKTIHLPSLEKLADIYRSKAQKDDLEIISRVLLAEYKKKKLKEKMLQVLGDLVDIHPDNENYYYDYRKLKEDLGISDEDLGADQTAIRVDEAKEIIEATLAKADLYVEQGLMRNAKRILENLKMRFPDEPKISKKLDRIKALATKVEAKDIVDRVGEVRKKETQMFDGITEIEQKDQDFLDEEFEEKLTAADIFAETDIIPIVPQEEGEENFYDLSDRIESELEAIYAVIRIQMQGDTATVEKALSDIVADFRLMLDDKVSRDDYESHFNLAVAFMEQELYDEAIEECKLAAKSKKLELDSFSTIGHCFRQKKDYREAYKWLTKAQKLTKSQSSQYFALHYELASLHEDMKEASQALRFYREVSDWDKNYRDVKDKLKDLADTG